MKRANTKRLIYITLGIVLISVLVLFSTIMVRDVMCFAGSKSFKIEEKNIPVWIKAKITKELHPFKSIDKKRFVPLHKLVVENKIRHLVYVKIVDNKAQVIGEYNTRTKKRLYICK